MGRSGVLQEVRVMRFEDLLGRYSAGRLSCEEEGTMSSFRGFREVIEQHGLFGSLYADRGSHYWIASESGKIDRHNRTQVHRALGQLGIELI
jgi:hypothetical protein